MLIYENHYSKLQQMKIYLPLALFLLIISFSFGQREISESELITIHSQIEKDAVKLRDSLTINKDEFTTKYGIEIKVDIFKVKELRKRKIEINWSSKGMSNAVYEEEKNYDKLLNKYYSILKSKLSVEDGKTLAESQRNWIKFRDTERKLSSIISNEKYSGGGTIQSNIRAGKFCEITEQRLLEIISYINRIIE
ncbi:lysozyme inhibitor LprI family protein [Winogradskyella immobilis]|uniref:DUF1311 domain-containing protein n=1 Tax=Winogradskyella immobilis TaxID=2816852 RepID=A0ABS8ENK4_9FLAO|nr:lysozyme inhibitor LprI family protein [Winogradskyella immobilis]MCC1484786.1 DUF1311 domain-containing protein [Winogradskyella immobilis]MCG0016878.1 DUF1311 domain-containing protein [Winogradskyella immobilis]